MLANPQPIPVGFSVSSIIWFAIFILPISFLLIRSAKRYFSDLRAGKIKKLNPLFWIFCTLGGAIDLLIIGFFNGWNFTPSEVYLGLIVLIIPGILTQCLYFLPYLIANRRGHPQETAIFILTLFTGWTILAWIIALVWAFTNPKPVSYPQKAPASNADELMKYKALLDNGVISQEEFEQKKKDLLNT